MAVARRDITGERVILSLSIEEADALRAITGYLAGNSTEFSRITDAISFKLYEVVHPDCQWEHVGGSGLFTDSFQRSKS